MKNINVNAASAHVSATSAVSASPLPIHSDPKLVNRGPKKTSVQVGDGLTMPFKYTKHAAVRANQRGIKKDDIELIRRCGTSVHDKTAEVYFLRDKDIKAEISNMKKVIQRLSHLRNCQVVFSGDDLVTVCRLNRRAERSLSRREDA
jgi:hypothetical protein